MEEQGDCFHDEYTRDHIVYGFHEGQCQLCNVVILSVDASSPADDGCYGD